MPQPLGPSLCCRPHAYGASPRTAQSAYVSPTHGHRASSRGHSRAAGRIAASGLGGGGGRGRPLGGQRRRSGAGHFLALRGQAVPGPAADPGRRGGALRAHRREPGRRLRFPLERAVAPHGGGRLPAPHWRCRGRARLRAAPAPRRRRSGAGGPQRRDPNAALEQLLRQARGYAGAGPGARLAAGRLRARRSSGAGADPQGR